MSSLAAARATASNAIVRHAQPVRPARLRRRTRICPTSSRIRTTTSTPPRMCVVVKVEEDDDDAARAAVGRERDLVVLARELPDGLGRRLREAVGGRRVRDHDRVGHGLRGAEGFDVLHADARRLHRDDRPLPRVVELAREQLGVPDGMPEQLGHGPEIGAIEDQRHTHLEAARVRLRDRAVQLLQDRGRDLLRDRRVERVRDQHVARRVAVRERCGRDERDGECRKQHEHQRQAAHSAQGTPDGTSI